VDFWTPDTTLGNPPAVARQTITWTNELVKAELHVQITPCGLWEEGCHLTSIKFNGNTVWTGDTTEEVVVDVTQYMSNGINELVLDYNVPWWIICIGWCVRVIAAYVLVWSTGEVVIKPPPGQKPWWMDIITPILILVGIGVGAVILIEMVRPGTLSQAKERVIEIIK